MIDELNEYCGEYCGYIVDARCNVAQNSAAITETSPLPLKKWVYTSFVSYTYWRKHSTMKHSTLNINRNVVQKKYVSMYWNLFNLNKSDSFFSFIFRQSDFDFFLVKPCSTLEVNWLFLTFSIWRLDETALSVNFF